MPKIHSLSLLQKREKRQLPWIASNMLRKKKKQENNTVNTYTYILKNQNGGIIQGTVKAKTKTQAQNKIPNKIDQPYRLVTIQPY